MTLRERMVAVIEGRRPDRIPWNPRLELWYRAHTIQDTMPEKYKGKTLEEIQKILGVCNPARTFKLYGTEYEGVNITENVEGDLLVKTYSTPAGSLYESFRINPEARGKGLPFVSGEVDYLVKKQEDYKIMEYIINCMKFIPNNEGYAEYDKKTGDSGIPMVVCGNDPMFVIMHDYIGYNRFYYEMADNPDEVKHLHAVLCEKYHEFWDIMLKSHARIIIHGAHYDSMMTPPGLYGEYMQPYLKEIADRLHDTGKILCVHADADSRLLMKQFMDSGIDMLECFCTFPMVSVTMEEALDAFGGRMTVMGGIPSTLLVPASTSYEDFTSYMDALFTLLKRDDARVILGISDNVMPEADIGRVEKICEMVDSFTY